MRWMRRLFLVLGLFALTTTVNAQSKNLVVVDASFKTLLVPGESVNKICEGLEFTEGPVWVPRGNYLLFSDIDGDTIYKWSKKGGMKVFRTPSNNANGNFIDNKGRLLTCEHGSRTVTRTIGKGKIETIASTHKGGKLNSPNDITVKKDGTIWFTDPTYGLEKRKQEQKGSYLFRLDPGAKEPVAVVKDFVTPNGICLSPDQKRLYVSDTWPKNEIRCFDVKDDNTLVNGRVFAKLDRPAPDGLCVDTAGRLYTSSGDGVQVFTPEGKLIGRILTPKPGANCCFGGKKRDILFIAARDSVWAVRLAVTGK